MALKEVDIKTLTFNPFDKIGKEWMLVTAGDMEECNTMTASWGGLGVIWNKNVATIYIRPQRYTKKFIDANDAVTLSFLSEEYRKQLGLAGRISGYEDGDKWEKIGLNPCYIEGIPAVEEADMIFVCKKLYAQDLTPESMIEDGIDEANYPDKDYHTMYICEIEKVFVRE